MMIFIIALHLFEFILQINGKEKMLLNGSPFPSSIFIPMDKSYLLECQAEQKVYWKIYSMKGKVQIIANSVIRLNEYDVHRNGFYQCYSEEKECESKNVFIFSHSARAIDRQWSGLIDFHPDLITHCRPLYFNFGFNEQFIELVDSEQIVRYNRSSLLVKHIRSTTHLLCKLHLDTTSVGVRVQTLLRKDHHDSPLLSDQYLQKNDYLDLKTNERDFHRIAFEGDSIYFHCPTETSNNVEWSFLSWNYYSLTMLPIIFHTDTKLSKVKIEDAGMYTCRSNGIAHKRVILTILHPPRSSHVTSEHTVHVQRNSKHVICCHLDAFPYPTYVWTMKTDVDTTTNIWCLKRCCWLHVLHRKYDQVICTSMNTFGTTKYTVHILVNETDAQGQVVYADKFQ